MAVSLGLEIQIVYTYFYGFSKIFDFVTPQGFKDIIKNLQGRISELVDLTEEFLVKLRN